VPVPEFVGINQASYTRLVFRVTGARFDPPDASTPGVAGLSLGEALEQLVTALQQAPPFPPPPDHATTSLLLQWLQVRFSFVLLSQLTVSAWISGFTYWTLPLVDVFPLASWNRVLNESKKRLLSRLRVGGNARYRTILKVSIIRYQ
jgi:hypothetical protein